MLIYALALVLIIFSGWILALSWGLNFPYHYIVQAVNWLQFHPWESSLITVLTIALGGLILIRPRHDRTAFPTISKLGEVKISRQALQDIIIQSATSLQEVRTVIPSLRYREGGLEINISSQVVTESIIPEISSLLQEKVKKDVELYTGIRVAEVRVLVRGIEGATRLARVR